MKITLETFKEKLSTIHNIIYFDDHHYLREKTSDREKLTTYIEQGEYLLVQCSHHKEDMYFLHGTLGNLYRIYEKPYQAIPFLEQCLDYARKTKNITKEIVSLIRYGEALKYADNHNESLNMFHEAFKLCQEHDITNYLDFVWQHEGKCLLEVGQIDDAEKCFAQAMNLRQEKGEQTLIQSTEQALNLIQKMKAR